MEPTTNTFVPELMAGADAPDAAPESPFDFNFGHGQEQKDEATPDAVPETPPETPAPLPDPVVEPVKAEEPAPVIETPPEAPKPQAEQRQKGPMVPKQRLDEVLAKQRMLQKQVDDLLASRSTPPAAPETYDFSAREVEYQNLVLDGQSAKAAELRQQIRQAERTQLEYDLTQRVEQKVFQSQQEMALQQAATSLEQAFPVFDRESPHFNEKITQEVVDLRDAFIVKGENPVLALSKAAKFVIREHDLVGDVEVPEATAPLPTPEKATATPQVDEVARRRAEVTSKLKTAASQPPGLTGESSASHGEKTFDLSTLTEDEFNALPAATLKRLRGDII
jgi:hypothetical protein